MKTWIFMDINQRLLTAGTIMALSVPLTAHADGTSTFQAAQMVDFNDGTAVPGAGTLLRSRRGVHARLAMADLDPESAYIVSWIVWNNPALCSEPCGGDDLGIPGNSVFYAAGFVTGPDGAANITADLSTGKPPAGIDVLIEGGLKPGKAFRAEIHMVVTSQGKIQPPVDEQISSFIEDGVPQRAVVFAPQHVVGHHRHYY